MKLVFYSGGDAEDNKELDQTLIDLCQKKKILMAYIPACSYACEDDYESFLSQYQNFNIDEIVKFEVDRPFSKTLLKKILKSDIIHLGGGNTFYFLKELKKSGFLGELELWIKNGGILTGLSAGAIIMTKNIHLAGVPSFDRDENIDQLKNLKSMGLVKFDFFPHYKNSARYDKELLKCSKESDRPLYACPDGSGLVVFDKEIRFIGKTYCFHQGKKFTIHQ